VESLQQKLEVLTATFGYPVEVVVNNPALLRLSPTQRMLPRHKALLALCGSAARGDMHPPSGYPGPLAAPSVLLKSPAAFDAYMQRRSGSVANDSMGLRLHQGRARPTPRLRRAALRCKRAREGAVARPALEIVSKAAADSNPAANADASDRQRGRGNARVRL
jgi:hypothetical protein